jgi:hypothetical protein
MRSRIVAALVAVLVALAIRPAAHAQPLEPPPEAPEGVDYVIEPADSLAVGDVELGVGAASRAGGAPIQRRRVRWSGDGVSGAVREGASDPIAGGSIDGHGRLGAFSAGRLAPRWGRGLLLGAAGDPWQSEALDRGAGAAFRGRSGSGVMLEHGAGDSDGTGVDLLYGRFSRHRLAGLRVRRRALALGALADGRGGLQSSLTLSGPGGARRAGEAELVWDRAGRWRAEGILERRLAVGPVDSTRAPWTVNGRVRGGTNGFASLAEGIRAGPSRALAAGLSGPLAGPLARYRLRTMGALWRFRPGAAGARAGLAIERPLAHHGSLALGFEEQRGPRRDVLSASAAMRAEGLRQGWWGEWWSGAGILSLGVRHESWGDEPWGRGVVRSVTGARLEARGPLDVRLAIAHSVFHARRGESLYLPEAESDRLVLRAVSGDGERTRIELRAPFAGGRARAALHVNTAPERRARAEWTLDWTRRARLRRAAGSAPE